MFVDKNSSVISGFLLEVTEKSPIKTWVRTADYKEFTYLNPAYLVSWPFTQAPTTQQPLPWLHLIHPEDAEMLVGRINKELAHNRETSFDVVYRLKDDLGQISLIKENIHTIYKDGQLHALAGHAHVIQRRPVDDEPYVVGHVLQRFAERSRDVFWVRNADYSQQLFLSPSFEEIWGRDCSIVYSEPNRWAEFLHPDDAERLSNSVAQRTPHIEAGATFLMEYRIIRPNGDIRWIRDESFPIYDDTDSHIGFAGIAQDITKEKELETAKELAKVASKSKSEFLANMSHDLRTPLNWLLGAAELLQKRNKDSAQHKLFEMIVDGGKRIQQMVEEILDYAKLESGKLPLHHEPLNFRQCIEEVVNMLSSEANQKNIAIIVEYPDNVPSYVIGDAQRLRRITLNLLGNALKFTIKGHIHIKAEQGAMRNNQVELNLLVSDTGIGIPQDKVQSIFDRFEKVQPSYQGQFKGVGLGLAIVKKFVEGMKGRISVSSVLHQGSTFKCILPLTLQKNPLHYSQWQQHFAKEQIVIIDDLTQRAASIAQLTQADAKHPNVVLNSQQALELLAQQNFPNAKIIMIDDEISAITPIALMQKIQSFHLDNRPMCLCLKKPSMDAELAAVKDEGFFDYLLKPCLPTELLDTLSTLWLRWQAADCEIQTLIKAFKPKVLLVEDEPFGQRIVSMLLEEELHSTVRIAHDGQQALQALSEENFDLVLMDIGLPDQDGLTITKHVRKKTDHTAKVPIVALTAHASDEMIEQCVQVGMQAHLTKPTCTQDLLQIIVDHVLQLD